MKDKSDIRNILLGVAFLILFGIAGEMDYQEAVDEHDSSYSISQKH